MNKPPVFTKEKLEKILHYTDLDVNPTYNALVNSNTFYKIFCGAKGVSKSFGQMVYTIYRLVNENNFCSLWCRNLYKHIKNTLIPMLNKVLDFLANVHGLDYRPYITIYSDVAVWNYDDGGNGRAIYFQNWENIQSFQGFTLRKTNFRFGELIIDEPLEDTNGTDKTQEQLLEIYELQKDKLPLLIHNTILREKAPDNFKIYVCFLFNIFTLDHFLVAEYLNNVIPIVNSENEPNLDVMQQLIEDNYIQAENLKYEQGLGLIATMFSKLFVPKNTLSEYQLKEYQNLKDKNYRLWVITVAGFGLNNENKKVDYFMKNILYTETGELRKNIKVLSKKKLYNLLENRQITSIFVGYDNGEKDNASFCASALVKDTGEIIVFELIKDLKTKIKSTNTKKTLLTLTDEVVVKEVQKIIKMLDKHLPYDFVENNFDFGYHCVVFNDHSHIIDDLNKMFLKNHIHAIATRAIRRTTRNLNFGIEVRQGWQKVAFSNNLIKLTKNCMWLLPLLAKQVILHDKSEKRDETINKEIYDVVNAFEYSCCAIANMQMALAAESMQNKETQQILEKWRIINGYN